MCFPYSTELKEFSTAELFGRLKPSNLVKNLSKFDKNLSKFDKNLPKFGSEVHKWKSYNRFLFKILFVFDSFPILTSPISQLLISVKLSKNQCSKIQIKSKIIKYYLNYEWILFFSLSLEPIFRLSCWRSVSETFLSKFHKALSKFHWNFHNFENNNGLFSLAWSKVFWQYLFEFLAIFGEYFTEFWVNSTENCGVFFFSQNLIEIYSKMNEKISTTHFCAGMDSTESERK